jgi:dTDP-4-dehydrorhamnose 3,5-epimerase
MKLLSTPIEGLSVAETTVFRDNRGAFARLFCRNDISAAIGEREIIQINHSRTARPGAIRGMHFQRSPRAEMKLVRCIRGRVWDVAVDLRANSATFLHWHAEELSEENARMFIIPEGCAHGFQVLEPDTELLYLHTEIYAPDAESGVAYNDPRLAISWPLAISELSERDQHHPFISPNFQGLTV